MDGIVFKTHQGNRYYFDAQTGVTFCCSDVMFNLLNDGKLKTEEQVLSKYKNKYPRNDITSCYKMMKKWNSGEGAFFTANHRVHGDDSRVTDDLLKNGPIIAPNPQLILIVTEDCNLRCRYCVFSGSYKFQRRHSQKYMDFSTAEAAISYFFTLLRKGRERNPFRKPAIGFYGGEPLLNFDLIKEVVQFVEHTSDSDFPDLRWSITTNGTLLNRKTIDFLLKHNFLVNISLDGPKNIHDKNRVFQNGKGTFRIIMGNLQKFRTLSQTSQDEPAYNILVTHTKCTDLRMVNDFFVENCEIFEGVISRVNPITPYYTTYYKDMNCDTSLRSKSINVLFKKYIQFISSQENRNSKVFFLRKLFEPALRVMHDRSMLDNFGGDIFQCGECIPGAKIAVDCDGNFHTCEKINYDFPIGNVMEGLDFRRIRNMTHSYFTNVTKKCRGCNISRLCQRCYASCAKGDHFKIDEEFCMDKRKQIIDRISFLYSILERNPTAFRKGGYS